MLITWKRTLQITMVSLASLVGCGRQPPLPPAVASAKGTFVVDYAHASDGVFHHGTFSLIDGKVAATWTLDRGGKKESWDIPMTQDAFESIWNGVTDIPDFQTGIIRDPNQRLDIATHHVVGIVFSLGEQKGMRTCVIPSATASAQLKEWLTKIGYTGK